MIQEFETFLNYWVNGIIKNIMYLENDEISHTTHQEITCAA